MADQPENQWKHNNKAQIAIPDTEVRVRATRRSFSSAYKRRIVEEADQCAEPGSIGALLRREGLYSSQLSKWRQQHAAGTLGRSQRGRKVDALGVENAKLKRENERLRRDLEKAQLIMDVQKKLAQALELDMAENRDADEDS